MAEQHTFPEDGPWTNEEHEQAFVEWQNFQLTPQQLKGKERGRQRYTFEKRQQIMLHRLKKGNKLKPATLQNYKLIYDWHTQKCIACD